ncbi:MAG: FAD-dependent oxidoreductase, partial [Alphaproteobacteria bacterium]|nr:FAD-dependent oxidoreductase [Alphaproteobacteria bacterium]
MATGLTRRAVVAGLGGLAGLSLAPAFATGAPAHVIVIGGGFGGTSAARQLSQIAPSVRVTLVEPNKDYIS